jgi:outer membrane protein assembly factor BamB
MVFLDTRDGRLVHEEQTGRPAGDPVELEDAVLLPTLDGRLVGFRARRRAFEVPLPGRTSAGLVVGHGRAWAGLSDGSVLRIDRLGGFESIRLPGRETDVVALAPHADGLLVSRRDGALFALDAEGTLLWQADNLGDLEGQPARAGGVAAVADTRGRVLLFAIGDGAVRGQVDLQGPTRNGLLGHADALVAALQDGRLWVYDPARQEERLHVNLEGAARFPIALLGKNTLGVSVDGARLSLVELPPSPTR